MNNLSNLGVQELNANEVREIEGGKKKPRGKWGWLITIAEAAYSHAGDVWDAYHEGQDPNNPLVG